MSYNRRPFNNKFPVKCFHSSKHPKSNFAPASSNNNPISTSTAPITTVAAAASSATNTITSSMPSSSTLLSDSAETKPNTQQRWMEWDQYCQQWVEYVYKGQNSSNDQADPLSIDSIHSYPALPSGTSGGGGGGGGGNSSAISDNVEAQSLNSDIKSISTGKTKSHLNGSVKPLNGFKQSDENTSKSVSASNTLNATSQATASKANRDHHASTQPVNKNEKSHQNLRVYNKQANWTPNSSLLNNSSNNNSNNNNSSSSSNTNTINHNNNNNSNSNTNTSHANPNVAYPKKGKKNQRFAANHNPARMNRPFVAGAWGYPRLSENFVPVENFTAPSNYAPSYTTNCPSNYVPITPVPMIPVCDREENCIECQALYTNEFVPHYTYSSFQLVPAFAAYNPVPNPNYFFDPVSSLPHSGLTTPSSESSVSCDSSFPSHQLKYIPVTLNGRDIINQPIHSGSVFAAPLSNFATSDQESNYYPQEANLESIAVNQAIAENNCNLNSNREMVASGQVQGRRINGPTSNGDTSIDGCSQINSGYWLPVASEYQIPKIFGPTYTHDGDANISKQPAMTHNSYLAVDGASESYQTIDKIP